MFHRTVLSVVLLLALGACATLPTGSANIAGSWQDLGVNVSGNVSHAIDTRSISRQGDVVSFRERVSIRRMQAQSFTQTPPYQTAINQWQMNCRQKNYRLMAVQLFDASGKLLADHHYASGSTQAVRAGSASERQFERVCSQS